MKRAFLFMLIAFFSSMFAVNVIGAPKKVAVVVVGNISESQKSIIDSSIMARLADSKDNVAYERNEAFLKALMKEQDYQLSGEVPDKEIREVGERMGVDYVIAVNVNITDDDKCHMSARMIMLESGRTIKTVNNEREYEGTSTLSAMANNIAYRLLSKKSK